METKMQSIDQRDKAGDDFDAQRAILTKSIDDVASEIGIALKDAGLLSPFTSAFEQAATPWQRSPHRSIRPTTTGNMQWQSSAKSLEDGSAPRSCMVGD